MPARSKSAPKDSTASPGFEATALRGSVSLPGIATLRSLKGNRWLAADSRSTAETAEGNRSNNMDAEEPGGTGQPERSGDRRRQTATGSPQGERGGAEQYKAENVFWVPADARWSHLQASARQPTVGMSNLEVRMPNRSRFTSTFEIRQSKFE